MRNKVFNSLWIFLFLSQRLKCWKQFCGNFLHNDGTPCGYMWCSEIFAKSLEIWLLWIWYDVKVEIHLDMYMSKYFCGKLCSSISYCFILSKYFCDSCKIYFTEINLYQQYCINFLLPEILWKKQTSVTFCFIVQMLSFRKKLLWLGTVEVKKSLFKQNLEKENLGIKKKF